LDLEGMAEEAQYRAHQFLLELRLVLARRVRIEEACYLFNYGPGFDSKSFPVEPRGQRYVKVVIREQAMVAVGSTRLLRILHGQSIVTARCPHARY
jgi:hypothetical protein